MNVKQYEIESFNTQILKTKHLHSQTNIFLPYYLLYLCHISHIYMDKYRIYLTYTFNKKKEHS